MPLTSVQNPLLKNIRAAAAAGRPTDDGLIVAEGPNLLREALRSLWSVEQIFYTEAAAHRHGELLRSSSAELMEVSARALSTIAAAESTQEIIALLRPKAWAWPDLLAKHSLLVAMDRVQDPGNAGTIVRSGEAFGATGMLFLQGSTRVSNGKFLRASAGSIFRLPFLEAIAPADFLNNCMRYGLNVFSLDMRRSLSIGKADFRESCVVVVGSEGCGLRQEILEASTAVSIPTRKVESLNAAVACSLALFEAFRQRNIR